jgi:hypothetical protein
MGAPSIGGCDAEQTVAYLVSNEVAQMQTAINHSRSFKFQPFARHRAMLMCRWSSLVTSSVGHDKLNLQAIFEQFVHLAAILYGYFPGKNGRMRTSKFISAKRVGRLVLLN